MRRPGLSRKLLAIHEQTALAGLIAIAVHGITLLGDPWLHPGVAGVTVPFVDGLPDRVHRARHHRRLPGDGLLGLSFYARKRVGAKLWRKAHRATVLVYVLGLVHALGAGSDASAPWFRWWVIVTTPPIAGLFVYRVLSGRAKKRAPRRCRSPAAPGPRQPRPAGLQNPSPRGGMMSKEGVVIVGGGLAAQRCAESLRRRGYEAPVRIVCAEPEPPYDRPPLSKAVLAGEAGRGVGRLPARLVVRGERGRAAARRSSRAARRRGAAADARLRRRRSATSSC